ncbi:hypothetical protein CO172_00790 [Candidatus Uhrbacteria bacterium CG_4_9_14_3_um_filter_36_7]|uniref:Response regulatory domain-containing protein n=1 Tax=Candidatus Uhrbacteria bacterium CG_4_9_14_3_um_filter_36_7 TaxID=1975033 RepID=A0A2M7XI70_9BACT|nr:MAG: hypothetical protein CO172_00790 [Candidatus Uhrbacteria bacterium CG_4_9_14_3_um_filter_36_7]
MKNKPKILLLESDKVYADILRKRMIEKKYQVKIISSIEEARKTLEHTSYHLFLFDIAVNQDSGRAFFEDIEKEKTLILPPIIILTDHADRETIQKMMAYGVKAYFLKKQTHISSILKKIIEVLEN